MSSPVLRALVNVPLPFRLAGDEVFLKALRCSIIDKESYNGRSLREFIEELLKHWRRGTPNDFFNSSLEILAPGGTKTHPINLLNTQLAGADWALNVQIF